MQVPKATIAWGWNQNGDVETALRSQEDCKQPQTDQPGGGCALRDVEAGVHLLPAGPQLARRGRRYPWLAGTAIERRLRM